MLRHISCAQVNLVAARGDENLIVIDLLPFWGQSLNAVDVAERINLSRFDVIYVVDLNC